jgi:hypothetical protein
VLTSRTALAISLCVLTTLAARNARAQCPDSATAVAKEFLRLDYSGYRLSGKGHEAIWALTDANGEAPNAPIFVTRSFRIRGTAVSREECLVRVSFETLGSFHHESFKFRPKREKQSFDVFVMCQSGTCKIELDPDKFTMPPHPSTTATLSWLSELQNLFRGQPQEKEIHSSLQGIARVIEDP